MSMTAERKRERANEIFNHLYAVDPNREPRGVIEDIYCDLIGYAEWITELSAELPEFLNETDGLLDKLHRFGLELKTLAERLEGVEL